ncbi:acyl-[acyl-carrier-protein] desaturase [Ekhidna lutea]|uniref:Acyl-[acyl-carrier-protein] desaturase n=1 Tax=Ekhidna lutea TaxID=447679 RepID=A0A239JEM9_EKHLU|nr:acyl-ACP desaturase [Ekhidna lutea]SNT04257.1 acyl-[acyl-carrier-protein] desaturase [Ekhidna lutea]
MNLNNVRREVMKTLEKSMDELMEKYLKPIETIWQPSDILPDSSSPDFIEEIRDIQGHSAEMDYDLFAVLIGDTITEEALPTYESWLMDVEGVNQDEQKGWTRWVRGWTAEENRHGDLLSKYLYLSGRVNMREMELSTHHLLNDGFDIQTAKDPYRSFIYTSFQELATNISHRRVASLAKKAGNALLAKMCGMIASDESRHASAYKNFVKSIFEIDPSEAMIAFEDMMRKKIVMPAHFLRESGGKIGELFKHFSDAAQRTMVYTTQDYIDILNSLLKEWDIDSIKDLNAKAEEARDFLMALPDRLQRLSERVQIPEKQYQFKWIAS